MTFRRRRRLAEALTDIVEATLKSNAGGGTLNPPCMASIVPVLEDGFRLHRPIDSEATLQIVIKAGLWGGDVAIIPVIVPYDSGCARVLDAAQSIHQPGFQYVQHFRLR